MLIFSGADLVGKTTLVSKALKALNAMDYPHMAAHLSRPPESFDYYQGYIGRCLVDSVWDRFHLDCLVYRQLDEHASCMTPLKYDLVDSAVRASCGFVVVVLCSEEEIRRRHEERDDVMYDVDHIVRVNEAFRRIAERPDDIGMRGERYKARVDWVLDNTRFDEGDASLVALVETYASRLEEFAELG